MGLVCLDSQKLVEKPKSASSPISTPGGETPIVCIPVKIEILPNKWIYGGQLDYYILLNETIKEFEFEAFS